MYKLFFLVFVLIFTQVNAVRHQKNNHPSSKPFKKNNQSPIGYVVSEDPLPYCGRLGNQLFVVSTVLAYAWDNSFKPIFPSFNREDNNLSYNRERIFFRLDNRKIPLKIHETYVYPSLVFKSIPIFKNTKNISIQGKFVNYKYFHHHRDKLLAMFEPSPKIVDYLHHKYADLLANSKTVAVHVRTFSQKNHDDGCLFVGLKFFELAFQEYPTDSTFVVFTDRLNWCKRHFAKSFPDKSFVFIEGNDHVEDLYLMSMMKHQIISNSTYSWWGAYLNKNPNKIVSCPLHMFIPAHIWPIEDTYLPDWNIVQYDFTGTSYPADMTDYDEKTADDLLIY